MKKIIAHFYCMSQNVFFVVFLYVKGRHCVSKYV